MTERPEGFRPPIEMEKRLELPPNNESVVEQFAVFFKGEKFVEDKTATDVAEDGSYWKFEASFEDDMGEKSTLSYYRGGKPGDAKGSLTHNISAAYFMGGDCVGGEPVAEFKDGAWHWIKKMKK